MRIFDVMCKDGDIWMFDTSIGDISSFSWKRALSRSSSVSTHVTGDNRVSSSTPAVTDVSEAEDIVPLLAIKTIKHSRKSLDALVHVYVSYSVSVSHIFCVLFFYFSSNIGR